MTGTCVIGWTILVLFITYISVLFDSMMQNPEFQRISILSLVSFLLTLKYLRMGICAQLFPLFVTPHRGTFIWPLFFFLEAGSMVMSASTYRTAIIFPPNYVTILSTKSAWLSRVFHFSDNCYYMSCHAF